MNSWSSSAGLEEIVACCRLTYRYYRLGNELAFVVLVTALPPEGGIVIPLRTVFFGACKILDAKEVPT